MKLDRGIHVSLISASMVDRFCAREYHRTDTPDAGPAAWNFIASTEGGAVEHLRTKYLLCWVSVISSIEGDNITCFLECSEEYT